MRLLDEFTDKDLRDLAAMVGPYLKASSISVEQVPSAETLEGIRSLPGVQFLNGVKRTVSVPVSSLRGKNGDKGDSLAFVCLGSYDTLAALNSAYPDGGGLHGFFKVDGMMYVWTGSKYEPLNLEVFKTFSLEQFVDVGFDGNDITVDYTKAPYAKVSLFGNAIIYNLSIRNTKDGSVGKVLVFQSGFKQISLDGNIRGTVDLPLNSGTIALLTYHRLGDTIYIHSNMVLGDIQFPTPQKIVDFQLVYSDSSACTVQWTSPRANNIYDKTTDYDMRCSNSLVDADDPKVWAGLRKIPGVPVPAEPDILQKMIISGLTPNKEYYIYLKSVKINYGVKYTSPSTDPVYFKTLGADDTSKPFRLRLTMDNLISKDSEYMTRDDVRQTLDRLIDEEENNIFKETGYPDMSNVNFPTAWQGNSLSHKNCPYHIIIDLFSRHTLDKLFVYCAMSSQFSVYAMKDTGYDWEYVGLHNKEFNRWQSVDFKGITARFIKLNFDRFYSCFTVTGAQDGDECWPIKQTNSEMGQINNLLLYGRPMDLPSTVMPPMRRSTVRKSFDQFFCSNGHAYQQGRIHSLISGEKVRMYIAFGHFGMLDINNQLQPCERITDMRFRVNKVAWVKGNNGTGMYFDEHLQKHWKKWGLKPFLGNIGMIDHLKYWYWNQKSGAITTDAGSGIACNIPHDNYFLKDAWKPIPTKGVGGYDKFLQVMSDPYGYKVHAKVCNALALRYGSTNGNGEDIFFPADETSSTALDLISGIEIQNEPDLGYMGGWCGYYPPESIAAMQSALYDGHEGRISDENEDSTRYGVKRADRNMLMIGAATAGVNRGYLQPQYLWSKAHRSDGNFPADVLSMHMYFSNIGNQGNDTSVSAQYGITFEEAMNNPVGGELVRMCAFRDRFLPDKEIWLTEFGWGESGGRGTQSKYQCYSQAGRMIGDWLLPDRHRSDVKGAWIVRACVQMMRIGVDMVNYYSTENESNWFAGGQWDSGQGFEMFHWNDCTDTTPGAKVAAVGPYEASSARGGFATTGLFGQILGNGAYPVSRAYWWISTCRNRLKGYIFTGMKYVGADERIVVACFHKMDESKGAYVVYLNDNQNTGVPGVEIPVPAGISTVRRVTVYCPDMPNPENVPVGLGTDQKRSGLPTSRYERYENGAWKITNRPYSGNRYSSYTPAPAVYPANPQEGDEIVIIPSAAENPYFPIVGPVWAKTTSVGGWNLTASEYDYDRFDWETEPSLNPDGTVNWRKGSNNALAWRQVDAVCDYIQYHPEGIHGSHGDETDIPTLRDAILVNVSEFPEIYLFDAVPDPDFDSVVSGLGASALSSSAVKLYWNNNSIDDTGYQIFVSDLPETGYSLLKTVPSGVGNLAEIAGLTSDTTYYYKVRPVCGHKTGTLSDYTSVKTFSELPAPTGLNATKRTATSISLSWNYTSDQVSDFVHYAVYRSESGSYEQVGRVADKSTTVYVDSGLVSGKNYSYRVRAVGLNGQSAYSDTLDIRTLLPEECPPMLTGAKTDKLGIRIMLTFDLPVGVVEAFAKDRFTLTEDGSTRLVVVARRDESNHNILVLDITQDSLKDYDKRSDIRISYIGGGVTSGYGIPLDGFEGVKVTNYIGNFTNTVGVYKLNLCGVDHPLPTGDEWNNIVGNPEKDIITVKLKDEYGRDSDIVLTNVQSKPQYSWGGPVDKGICSIAGIPLEVYKYGWRGPGYGANSSENMTARLKLSGLDYEHRYTVKVYGSVSPGTTIPTRVKVNSSYSPTVDIANNTSAYMIVEDNRSTANGVMHIDIINTTVEELNLNYPCTSFVIIEEFRSGTEPENKDVFLRSVTVKEAVDGIVKFPDLTLHLNCIGAATHYRVSESEDMSAAVWENVDDTMDIPYVLSGGYGSRTLYVQVKNLYSESNVRVIELEYRDPYVPLALKNVYINNDAGRTYSREVTVMLEKDGIPTHYKMSESNDLSGLSWSLWPSPQVSTLPFTLSEGSGQKTVYVQAMDSLTLCGTKADTINYIPMEYCNLELTLRLPAGVDPSALSLSFPILKYNKKFIFSYTADDGPAGAYGKVFCTVNKKWVDDTLLFHVGQKKTTGRVPGKTLGYTDGCGVEYRLPVGVAIWPNCGNANVPNFMDGKPTSPSLFPYIIWGDLPPILDFGGEMYYHNINQDVWGGSDPIRIAEGLKEDNLRTRQRIGRGMKVIMEPDGNHTYLTAGVMYDAIAMMFAQASPAVTLYPSTDPDLYKAVGYRRFYNDNNQDQMSWLQGIHDMASPEWAHIFTHTPADNICQLLTSVNDTFGKDGNDSVWMATVDEVYEYWFVRKNTAIRQTITGQTVTYSLSVPVDQDFYHKDLCLNIAGLSSLEGVNVEAGDSVLGLTYAINNGGLQMNLNYDEQTISRAEKYTALFETSVLAEDREDAMYFISHLRPAVAAPYLARITAAMKPPVLKSFSVPGTSISSSVTCTYTFSGVVTHYMISGDAGFTGAEWKTVTEEVAFNLPDAPGSYMVYFKLKNEFGESVVMSGRVSYAPLVVGGKITISFSNPANNAVSYDVVKGEVVNYICPSTYNGWTTNALQDAAGTVCCAFLKKKDSYPGTENVDYASGNNSLFAPEAIDDRGVYPAKYIAKYISNNKANAGLAALLRFTGVASGTYKLRILVSCGEGASVSEAQYSSMFYAGNSSTANLNYNPVNNMTRFIEIDNVVVADDGILDVKFWNTAGIGYRPGVNLIEIIKK